MKKTPQKPLMLAYIIFIGICCVYHIVCAITNKSFDTWDRIIVAVTIASYFFSVNSLNKMKLKQEEKNKELFHEEHLLLSRLKKKLTKDEDAPILKSVDEMLEGYKTSLPQTEKSIIKFTKQIFVFDVLGYLVFFLILGIDGISNYLSNATDLYTLLAFMTVLLVDYIENTTMARFEKSRQDIKAKTNSLYEMLTGDN